VWQAFFDSWKTSAIGITGAALLYFFGIGFALPATRGQWIIVTTALIVLFLGLAAKDADHT